VEEYVSTLCDDIAASAPAWGGTPLETVFFGGGTPSLLPPPQLGRILQALQRTFGLAPGAEVSMEMDPGAHGRQLCGRVCRAADTLCLRRHV
jgi:oxygen-independent coproporphyrinogen-3 oxidase